MDVKIRISASLRRLFVLYWKTFLKMNIKIQISASPRQLLVFYKKTFSKNVAASPTKEKVILYQYWHDIRTIIILPKWPPQPEINYRHFIPLNLSQLLLLKQTKKPTISARQLRYLKDKTINCGTNRIWPLFLVSKIDRG